MPQPAQGTRAAKVGEPGDHVRTALRGSQLYPRPREGHAVRFISTDNRNEERLLSVCHQVPGSAERLSSHLILHEPTREGAVTMPAFRWVNFGSETWAQRDSSLDRAGRSEKRETRSNWGVQNSVRFGSGGRGRVTYIGKHLRS